MSRLPLPYRTKPRQSRDVRRTRFHARSPLIQGPKPRPRNQNRLDTILQNPVAWLALFVSATVAVFTIWRFHRDIRVQSSQDYLTASTRMLERAYGMLEAKRSAEWLGLPEPDRLLWLTVARMLKEAEDTARQIKVSSHQTLYEHARNFWRGRLYDLLRPLGKIPITYFAEEADSIIATSGDERTPLSDKSLRVVLDFLRWPNEKPDPLEGAASFSDEEIDRMRSFEYRAVADFLEAQDAMLRGVQSRKDFWRQKFRDAANASSSGDSEGGPASCGQPSD